MSIMKISSETKSVRDSKKSKVCQKKFKFSFNKLLFNLGRKTRLRSLHPASTFTL